MTLMYNKWTHLILITHQNDQIHCFIHDWKKTTGLGIAQNKYESKPDLSAKARHVNVYSTTYVQFLSIEIEYSKINHFVTRTSLKVAQLGV